MQLSGAIQFLGAQTNDPVPKTFIDLRKFDMDYKSLHEHLLSISSHQYNLMQESGEVSDRY